MRVLALEINDSGLRVGSDEAHQEAGPGYAMLDPERLSLGEEARQQARLRPRRLHSRFWLELDTRSLPRPVPYAATAADLAHAQMADLWERFGDDAEAVVLVVPGYFGGEALGLLLGIARACEIPVRGMVDTAVASLAGRGTGQRMLHLDAHLHVSVLTELNVSGELSRGAVHLIDGSGVADLSQAWIDTVAKAYVHQTRFDPLHHAATEQSLFDRIDDWILALSGGDDLTVQIEHDGNPIAVQISRRQMLEAAAPGYERIARMVESTAQRLGPLHVAISDRIGRLPGLVERLGRIETVETLILPPAAAVVGALRFQAQICTGGEDTHFVIALPAGSATAPGSAAETETPPQVADDTRPRPTHLLADAVAWEISQDPLTIGSAPAADSRPVMITGNLEGVSRRHCQVFLRGDEVLVEDHSRFGTFVNDHRISSVATLRAGDLLRVGAPGSTLLLVEARS